MLKRLFLIALLAMVMVACGGEEVVEDTAEVDTPSETMVDDTVETVVEESEAVGVTEVEPVRNGTFTVDTANSKVQWLGAKAVGDSHSGTLDVSEGSLTIEDGLLVGGEFVVDMTTLDSDEGIGRLENHLKSDDFFSVDTYPTATLVINSAELVKQEEYNVSGDLTIKGATHPIEFKANAFEWDGVINARAEITFDRSLYDVRYGSGSFFSDLGDDLINDEIDLTVTLVANQ